MFRPLSLNTPIGAPDSGAELGDLLGNRDTAITVVDNRETLRPLLAHLPHRECLTQLRTAMTATNPSGG